MSKGSDNKVLIKGIVTNQENEGEKEKCSTINEVLVADNLIRNIRVCKFLDFSVVIKVGYYQLLYDLNF